MDAPSTLPRAWIERIFNRLHGVYGSQFSGKYHQGMIVNGVDAGLENAMQVWGEELAGFADHPEALKYALDNIDAKFPPSSKEFAAIARRAPAKKQPMIEHKLDPEQLARGLEKLQETQKKVKAPVRDDLDWARKPRSAMAFAALYTLAVREEDDRFAEILDSLHKAGHAIGDKLVRRYDYAAGSFVAV